MLSFDSEDSVLGMHPTEEKAKVVAAVWRTDLIQFLAAPAVLHQDYVETRIICTRMI